MHSIYTNQRRALCGFGKAFQSAALALALLAMTNVVWAESRQAAAERIAALMKSRPPAPVNEANRRRFIAERFEEARALVENNRTDGKLFRLLVSDLRREGATEELQRLGVLDD